MNSLAMRPRRRALLVGSLPEEEPLFRARLALVGVLDADVAQNTELAAEMIGSQRYCCGVFNLDDHHIDAWSLARLLVVRVRVASCMRNGTPSPLSLTSHSNIR